jgi:hypothetical protein
MLPPFIIEQIRRREEEERRKVDEQPRLDLPLDAYRPRPEAPPDEEEQPSRGIVILDLG